MNSLHRSYLVGLTTLLLGCASSTPPPRAEAVADVAATCGSPEADQCITLGCDEGWCAFFRCEDITPRVEPSLMPAARPPLRRGWGTRLGIRGSARPVRTFQWYPNVQVRPVLQLPPLVIPEHVHRYIHAGGPRGGRWNDAWAQFIQANPNPPPPDVIYRHAGELIFRFELTGKVVPYYRR